MRHETKHPTKQCLHAPPKWNNLKRTAISTGELAVLVNRRNSERIPQERNTHLLKSSAEAQAKSELCWQTLVLVFVPLILFENERED
jgi:hypothetical protein